MSKNMKLVSILILLCVVITAFPLMYVKNSEFGGADGAAEELITQIAPEYEPWIESTIEPPGSETESLLFALQAAFGSGVLCFGFGYFVARKKYSNTNINKEN